MSTTARHYYYRNFIHMDLPTTHYDESSTVKEVKNEQKATSMSSMKKDGVLQKIATYLFLFSVFFAPLIFIPSLYAPLDVVKAVFLSITITLSALLFAINALKNKTFVLPRSGLGYLVVGIIVSLLLSSFNSLNLAKSFIGQGFEITAASFILLMILAAFIVSRMVLKDKEMIFKIYSVLFVSFVILALFQIVRIFGGASFLSFGILSSVTSTIIGKWFDFAIFTGVVGLLSFLGIKFLPLRKGLKRLLVVSFVVSMILLFIINAPFIWGAFAVIVFCIGVYEFMLAAPKGDGVRGGFSRVSIFTLVILILSIGFVWKADFIGAKVNKSLNTIYGEVSLPWQLTLDITSDTLKESPILGAGPNRFGAQYFRFKPLEINQTQFFDSQFSVGFGLIPTFAATQGFLGIILWILFLIFFVKDGVRALQKVTDPLKKFFLSTSFFGASFLWIMDIIYVPSHVIIFLTAIFSGIFVALLVSEGFILEKQVEAREGRKFTQLAGVVFSVSVIVLLVWFGVYAKKAIAITYFQKGIKELNVNNKPDVARAKFMSALSWDVSDVYYQALSEINILKINALAQDIQAAATANPSAPADQKKIDQVVALVTEALNYTRSAEKIDKYNYYNYLAEARISDLAASLKIPNAYENAKNAYATALQVNPYNPAIYLNLARLEVGQNNVNGAEQDIGAALQLKKNYTDAAFLLSQIQVASGQIKEAINSTQYTIQLNPNEPLLYFQLGLLEYNDKDYATAIQALEKAVSLNDQYANARYFLGLSYARVGRNADAIAQFEALAKTNPDNQEVAFILTNLKEGKSPFTDAKPPIDSKPEKRKTLPVTEKTAPEKAPSTKTPASTTSSTASTTTSAKKTN
jgi:tetratricopeptide (TPR) repeat protein